MPKVFVARCEDYEYENVSCAVFAGLEAIGGIETLIGTAKSVAVKPNLIKTNKPVECVTTHPAVVQSVLDAVVQSGSTAIVVESPACPFTQKHLQGIFDNTGMTAAAKAVGAKLNDNYEVDEVHFEHGQSVKNMRIVRAVTQADAVISVAKLKTHAMLTYTGAIKNLFGIVPGLSKVECHFRLPDANDFASMIVDIAEYAKPPISVIDAVWGMEGEGPSAGDPRKLGAIIVSDSPFAADVVASRMIGLDPMDNPIVAAAIRRDLVREDDIELLGTPLKDLIQSDFKMPPIHKANVLQGRVPTVLEQILNKHWVLYPKFSKSKCKACGICIQRCPQDALKMRRGLPVLDKHKCINCFCCHEMCPHKAVGIHRPLALRIATKITK